MVMTLEEFFPKAAEEAVIKGRVRDYETRAMKFFREQFPYLAKPLNGDQLRKVVQLAYQNAKNRGITTERDHFKYLIIVAFWGSHFETDPQYQQALKTAGWIVEDEPSYMPYMTGLVDIIGDYGADFNKDLLQAKRVVLGFERLYTRPVEKINYESVAAILQNIWPTRYKRLGLENVHRFIGKAGEIAQKEFKLTGSDLASYIALAMYFGASFGHDPLRPWAGEALALTDEDARRHQLGEGAFHHFELLGGLESE